MEHSCIERSVLNGGSDTRLGWAGTVVRPLVNLFTMGQ